MFKELEGILKECSLNMTISTKSQGIAITVIPVSKEDSKKYLTLTPFVISDSPQVLDDTFVDQLVTTLIQAMPHLNNAEDFVKKAKEKEDKAKEEKAKPTISTTATKSDGKPVFSKNDAPRFKKVEDIIKRIGVTNDPDMISFAEKQAIKEAETLTSGKDYTIKLIKDAVKKQTDALAKKDKSKAKPLVMETSKAKDTVKEVKGEEPIDNEPVDDVDDTVHDDPDADAADDNVTAESDNNPSGESDQAPPADESFF